MQDTAESMRSPLRLHNILRRQQRIIRIETEAAKNKGRSKIRKQREVQKIVPLHEQLRI